MSSIYCIVSVFIFQLMSDIRRKRHLAQLVQNFFKNSVILKPDQPVSFIHHINNLSFQESVAKTDPCPRFRLSSRLNKSFPHIILFPFQKQNFDLCSCFFLCSDQAGRNHFRVIDHKAVSRVQIIHNFPECMMLRLSSLFVEDKESGR